MAAQSLFLICTLSYKGTATRNTKSRLCVYVSKRNIYVDMLRTPTSRKFILKLSLFCIASFSSASGWLHICYLPCLIFALVMR